MAEPISTGAAGAGAAKVLAVIFGSATLAAIVVMLCSQPETRREFAAALICTLVSSVSGGAAAVIWWELSHLAHEFFGLMALGGLFFVCGLPGWVAVRWAALWMRAHPDRSPFDLIREIRAALFG